MLGQALKELSLESEDEHISDLVERCRELEKGLEGKGGKREEGREVGVPLHRVGSTEEQEEVEK